MSKFIIPKVSFCCINPLQVYVTVTWLNSVLSHCKVSPSLLPSLECALHADVTKCMKHVVK